MFGDWSGSFNVASGRMLGMEETSPGVFALSQLDILGGNPLKYFIQGFGKDAAGEIYVLAKTAPGVSTLDPATGLPAGVILKIVPVPASTSVVLEPAKDNSTFQEAEFSNGAGTYLFAGATAESNDAALRRSMLAWTLTSIPAGSVITNASVALKMDRTIAPAFDFSLHKLTTNWGEGTANATGQEGRGIVASATDATWTKPFAGQAALWTKLGGDFLELKSATTSVATETGGSAGVYTWASPQLTADIINWHTTPSTNFGWLLKADLESTVKTGSGSPGEFTIDVTNTLGVVEGMTVKGAGVGFNAVVAPGGIDAVANTITVTVANRTVIVGPIYFQPTTAKRFVSRNSTTAANRPKLNLTYVSPPILSHRQTWEKSGYFAGQFINDEDDTDGDGIRDGIEYAWGYLPKVKNTTSGFSLTGIGSSTVNITFRRDRRATDLTYRAQVSTDLQTWTTLTTSTAGGVPSGTGYVSESTVDVTFRNVVVRDLPAGSKTRYYRLHVTRIP